MFSFADQIEDRVLSVGQSSRIESRFARAKFIFDRLFRISREDRTNLRLMPNSVRSRIRIERIGDPITQRTNHPDAGA